MDHLLKNYNEVGSTMMSPNFEYLLEGLRKQLEKFQELTNKNCIIAIDYEDYLKLPNHESMIERFHDLSLYIEKQNIILEQRIHHLHSIIGG